MSNGENGTASMNGNQHGSKCFCCPYGYHIDLDFVRYCENWQTMACDKIARGNEEKRRRRARQKQCQSMEFLLGLPDDKDVSIIAIAQQRWKIQCYTGELYTLDIYRHIRQA